MRKAFGLLLLGPVLAALVMVAISGGDTVKDASAAASVTGRINITATLKHSTGRPGGELGRISNASEQSWQLNDRYGRPIGRMLLQCRWVTARARFCNGEVRLPLGTIIVAGSSPTMFDGEWAVTGGTGKYTAGGGVMLFTAIGLRKTVLLITIET